VDGGQFGSLGFCPSAVFDWTMNRFWREPLVHFLLIGAGLFLVFGLTRDASEAAPNRILVTASQVQQLSAQFQRTWLRPPTDTELAGLIESYVRDEVFYREALAMGLDQDDPQVRRRMRLKLEFLLEDLSLAESPSDEVLNAYLQQHHDRFRIEPRLSFRQVYLSPDRRPALEADAERLLAGLRAGVAADRLGDPSMLPQEQTDVSKSEVTRTFGKTFAEQVTALEPGVWSGPLYSGLGAHLVLVTGRADGRLPELAEVRAEVEREYLAQRRAELKDAAYERLREGYEVLIEPSEARVDASGAVALFAEEGVPEQ
jgi:hypothetical protein